MTKAARRDERQQVLATARTYRRKGYRVTFPERGDPLPPFLVGLRPDLVAERDDDRVVIEIRRADSVPGSNDLVALAERVAPQRGWRFELIALAAPDEVRPVEPGAIHDEAERLAALGFLRGAFLVAYAGLENILAFAAVHEDIALKGTTSTVLARELVVVGAISSGDYDRIKEATSARNAMVHAADAVTPAALDALLALNRSLEQELLVTEKTSPSDRRSA